MDLRSERGRTAFLKLLPHYDVLVESFRPESMDRMGLGQAALAESHPRLIHCSISGFGQTGPDRQRAGHDLTYQARAGVLGLNGSSLEPAMPGTQIADISGAIFAVSAVLAALYAREKSGRGRHLDIALNESAMAFLGLHLGARMATGSAGPPMARGVGPLNGDLPTYGIYRTADDKFLAVGALEPKFAERFFAVLGAPELLAKTFDAPSREFVREEIQQRLRMHPQAEWVRRFSAVDACVEPVYEGDQVLSDPQLRSRGAFFEGGVATPLGAGRTEQVAAPSLGQHTREVLGEAGFTDGEIEGLVVPKPA